MRVLVTIGVEVDADAVAQDNGTNAARAVVAVLRDMRSDQTWTMTPLCGHAEIKTIDAQIDLGL